MITGYNTDVKHNDRVYHVQTEDRGLSNPVIETLVYVSGGQIVASHQYSYAGLVKDGKVDEASLADLLESQHRRIMRWASGGKFDPNGPPLFGSSIVSDRSFDEVVLDFVESLQKAEPLEVLIPQDVKPVAGEKISLRLGVRGAASGDPIAGARVTVALAPPEGTPAKLATLATAEDGTASRELKIPADSAGHSLHVEARLGGQVARAEVTIGPS